MYRYGDLERQKFYVIGTLFTSVPVCLSLETKFATISVHFSQTGTFFVFPQIGTHLKSVPACLEIVFYTGTLVKSVPVL
jgi:hypothetical protein